MVQGQPSEPFSLPPANSTCDGQVGNCLFLVLALDSEENPKGMVYLFNFMADEITIIKHIIT